MIGKVKSAYEPMNDLPELWDRQGANIASR